ncbi:hypothetical protein FOMPIDRAFT_92050 [Fomitopsis schrenkii]|uniref:Uncharacterized protein n=1 Tax=Fomitopsis schrenkii TaxID=2126942 RepID=S8DZS3_FOMSC|nr:hypothetical protein FOMPIDRAFT_92050 [Fomitopsis schrenkii]
MLGDHVALHTPSILKYYPFFPAPFPDFLTAIEDLGQVGERGGGDGDGALAGMLAFLKTSRTHKSTEIVSGPVLPASLRTHVACTAVTLGVLRYALQLPAMALPGSCPLAGAPCRSGSRGAWGSKTVA